MLFLFCTYDHGLNVRIGHWKQLRVDLKDDKQMAELVINQSINQ